MKRSLAHVGTELCNVQIPAHRLADFRKNEKKVAWGNEYIILQPAAIEGSLICICRWIEALSRSLQKRERSKSRSVEIMLICRRECTTSEGTRKPVQTKLWFNWVDWAKKERWSLWKHQSQGHRTKEYSRSFECMSRVLDVSTIATVLSLQLSGNCSMYCTRQASKPYN